MKRYAAHCLYLSPEKIYHLHVIELNDEGEIRKIFPLTHEIESTAFYNGMIVPVKKGTNPAQLKEIRTKDDLAAVAVSTPGVAVDLYRFEDGCMDNLTQPTQIDHDC